MKASALEMNLMGERSTWSETEQHKNDPKTVHRRRGWLLHVSWVLAVLVVLSLVGIIVGLTSVQSKLDHAQTQLHKTEQTMRMMDTDLHATQARLDADMKEVKNNLNKTRKDFEAEIDETELTMRTELTATITQVQQVARMELTKTRGELRANDTELRATISQVSGAIRDTEEQMHTADAKLEANITQARGEARQMANTINASLSADMDALKNRVASLEVIHAHPYPPRHV